jgi:hypothetical protein
MRSKTRRTVNKRKRSSRRRSTRRRSIRRNTRRRSVRRNTRRRSTRRRSTRRRSTRRNKSLSQSGGSSKKQKHAQAVKLAKERQEMDARLRENPADAALLEIDDERRGACGDEHDWEVEDHYSECADCSKMVRTWCSNCEACCACQGPEKMWEKAIMPTAWRTSTTWTKG